MTIAVDFDGTIVEHRYPEIGKEIPFATDTLKMLIKDHHRIIVKGSYWMMPSTGVRSGALSSMLSTVIIRKRRQTTTKTSHAS